MDRRDVPQTSRAATAGAASSRHSVRQFLPALVVDWIAARFRDSFANERWFVDAPGRVTKMLARRRGRRGSPCGCPPLGAHKGRRGTFFALVRY